MKFPAGAFPAHPVTFMSRFFRKTALPAGLALCGLSSAFAQVYYPLPGLADDSTGYMESMIGRDWYRGSAVVARDPRLIYSCGHLFYEAGVWATDYLFYRAYNDSREPSEVSAGRPRGFRYFTSYASRSDNYGQNSANAFALDFTVFYGAQSFGPAIACSADGTADLRSARPKRIAGYPETLDYTGARGSYYQHATNWFTTAAKRDLGNYYWFDGVSTGSGNSGGPVFVQDEAADTYSLAGILVSGSRRTAGVYALDAASADMASAALGAQPVSRTFSNASPLQLPDARSRYSSRAVKVSGYSATLSALNFSLAVKSARRSDLDIYLRSPSGRIRWINKHTQRKSGDITLNSVNFSSSFRGYEPNGIWRLKMRDFVAGKRSEFRQFSMDISGTAP